MVASVPYSERSAQQENRSVAIPIPVLERIRAYAGRESVRRRDAGRGRIQVTYGEVIELAMDALEAAEDQP